MIRLLIAEDIDYLREQLIQSLERAGDMQVVASAATGQEAVRQAEKCEFDIALLDIEMESAYAGIRAAERILDSKKDAKVIFLTIHETEEIIITAMGCGASDYVIKGCPDEELYRHIRSTYEGTPVMDERIRATVMQEYSRLRKSEQSLIFFITNISHLTGAERELLKYLLQGFSIAEIAKVRVVEPVTVKTQIKGILRKFGCSRTKEIVRMIQDMGIQHLFIN